MHYSIVSYRSTPITWPLLIVLFSYPEESLYAANADLGVIQSSVLDKLEADGICVLFVLLLHGEMCPMKAINKCLFPDCFS